MSGMDNILVAHLADTHLGYRQYNIYERELDIYDALDEAVDHMLEEHVELVIHAGDFFDTPKPPPQAVRRAIQALRRLKEHEIPVLAVLGDHDLPKRRGEHPLAILEEVGLIRVLGIPGVSDKPVEIRTRGGRYTLVAGLVHHRGIAREKLLARLRALNAPDAPTPKILVLHQALEGTSPEYELARGELPRGYSYYALGHIHRTMAFNVEGTIAAYPGSLDALRIDEAEYEEGHGFLLVDVGPRTAYTHLIRIETRPQPVYHVKYDALAEELRRIAAAVEKISRNGKKPLVHVIVEGENIDRKRVHMLVHRLLEKHTLYIHLIVQEKRLRESGVEVDVATGKLDRLEILKKLIGDHELAKLADEIIDLVALGGQEYELKLRIEEFFRKRYGDKP